MRCAVRGPDSREEPPLESGGSTPGNGVGEKVRALPGDATTLCPTNRPRRSEHANQGVRLTKTRPQRFSAVPGFPPVATIAAPNLVQFGFSMIEAAVGS